LSGDITAPQHVHRAAGVEPRSQRRLAGKRLNPQARAGEALVLLELPQVAEVALAAVGCSVQHLVELGIAAGHAGEALVQERNSSAQVRFGADPVGRRALGDRDRVVVSRENVWIDGAAAIAQLTAQPGAEPTDR